MPKSISDGYRSAASTGRMFCRYGLPRSSHFCSPRSSITESISAIRRSRWGRLFDVSTANPSSSVIGSRPVGHPLSSSSSANRSSYQRRRTATRGSPIAVRPPGDARRPVDAERDACRRARAPSPAVSAPVVATCQSMRAEVILASVLLVPCARGHVAVDPARPRMDVRPARSGVGKRAIRSRSSHARRCASPPSSTTTGGSSGNARRHSIRPPAFLTRSPRRRTRPISRSTRRGRARSSGSRGTRRSWSRSTTPRSSRRRAPSAVCARVAA